MICKLDFDVSEPWLPQVSQTYHYVGACCKYANFHDSHPIFLIPDSLFVLPLCQILFLSTKIVHHNTYLFYCHMTIVKATIMLHHIHSEHTIEIFPIQIDDK